MGLLQIFITVDEFEGVLQEFALTRALHGASYDGKFSHFLPEDSKILRKDEGNLLVFLFPSSAWEAGREPQPRQDGWISITAGDLHPDGTGGHILTMTTVQTEDHAELSFRPSNLLRALRRRIASFCTFGVLCRNVVHGGSGVIREIAYSPNALALHRRGVKWQQFPEENCQFDPK